MSRCPTCKRSFEPSSFEAPFPFCSQRCKLADLDGWLSERFVVSEPLPEGLLDASLLHGEDST